MCITKSLTLTLTLTLSLSLSVCFVSISDYVIPWKEIAEMELVIQNTLSEERKLLKAAMGWTCLESFWLSPTGSIGTGL